MFASVDAYCERTDASFWSEPVNAATNAAFVVAGVLLWQLIARLRAAGTPHPASVRSLPWLLGLIGLASFLFHTLATVWAGLADTLSILLFGCVFLYAFLRHVAVVAGPIALAGAGLFTLASYFTPSFLPAGLLNQSGAYFPYVAGLLGIAAYLRWRRRPGWRWFLLGILIFCVSLTLRTIDAHVCSAWPLGTHFLWHVLNAIVLFVLSRELVREACRPAVDRPAHG
ncbi:MAG TPA: ceramidase domain-containing protein [Burkholderiales bacterium]|nr:ceramidase domain-containing protein [Burkholderiales bacterium]